MDVPGREILVVEIPLSADFLPVEVRHIGVVDHAEVENQIEALVCGRDNDGAGVPAKDIRRGKETAEFMRRCDRNPLLPLSGNLAFASSLWGSLPAGRKNHPEPDHLLPPRPDRQL